ncbi:leucyl aminopeptidase, partial [Leucobacter sp. M11]|nr:leucyl aminopeptidase [Leucobacter sp. M11]
FLPLAENLPSGSAQKPGDVIVHPDGTRTEVTDTDAEGRLVIADGLAWLRGQGVACLVDAGTLTDGGGVGGALWGAWGTDRSLADAVLAAGAAAGEPGWLLPLHDRYRGALDSPVADLRNMPLDRPDIGQVAAEYLRRFAGDTPWLHLDIGSSAYLEVELGPWPTGATGSPVRALRRFLIDREA